MSATTEMSWDEVKALIAERAVSSRDERGPSIRSWLAPDGGAIGHQVRTAAGDGGGEVKL